MEKKLCGQCHTEKDLGLFRKVTNQHTGVHLMNICKECYASNQQARQRKQEEERQARNAVRKRELEDREERDRHTEQERLARQQAVETWYLQQPDRQCVACKQVLAASAFGYSTMREVDGIWLPAPLHRRCRACHEGYRRANTQRYPLCPMCHTPTRVYDFLGAYHGYPLDLIKVCCTRCIPHFEALPEPEQLARLRRAMVQAYGATAVIYALQYDDAFPCQHIGRTKDYTRRMGEYKRDWYKAIHHHIVLQQLSFGPLSMEYECRWMMYALKHRWPIDNFELFKGGEDGLSGMHTQARLRDVVHVVEPLTAPFEVIGPLIQAHFPNNTHDARIVNWYCAQYYRQAYPRDDEMEQRIVLMERLHGLRRISLGRDSLGE